MNIANIATMRKNNQNADENKSPLISLTAVRAYEIWQLRCQSDIWKFGSLGTEEGDWYQAEREI